MNTLQKPIITLLLFIFIGQLFAQKKQLTINDLMNYEHYPKRIENMQWLGSSDYYVYEKDNTLFKKHATAEILETVYTIEDLNKLLKKEEFSELKGFPQITVDNSKGFWFQKEGKILYCYFKPKDLKILNSFPEEAENVDIDNNNYYAAYTNKNNLFVSVKGKERQITKDENEDIVNGKSVHRREFGIYKGVFWSPKGNKLAFYRKDESMVTNYPLVDMTTRIAEENNIKYPMAGMKSHHASLGVYDMLSQSIVFLRTGEPLEQYLTNISWSPDEKTIYIAIVNREQNHLKLNQYDAVSGELIKTLFEEKNEKYVEPEHTLFFLPKQPDRFIWFSERDGYNHLYLYNTSGKLIKQLTKGNWIVKELLSVNEEETYLYFSATKESPLNTDIYSLDLNTGETKLISAKKGTNRATFHKKGKYFINRFSDLNTAAIYQIVDIKGEIENVLLEDINPLEEYEIGDSYFHSIKAKDGTELHSRVILPTNFDKTKKYPVFLYVYGGPHAQMVTNSWLGGANLFMNYMASQGFIVFSLDNRGSANRGFEFESAIFRNAGKIEVEDQMEGVKYLKSLPYVDEEKIFVQGWSYGGFMTMSLLMKNPGVFRAGVAGGPVTDWKYYEVMYGERYMDTPQENPEGYEASSLLNQVENLEDDLLIIHGAQDETVVWQHSLDFLKKCIKEGKQVDYFVYPTHKHNVRGKDRIHLYNKMEKYIKEKM